MESINQPKKILFVYLAHSRMSRSDIELDITELWHLVETLGYATVVDLITQKGEQFTTTYIGPGKVEEVSEYLKTHDIDAIIFNGTMRPSQKFTLLKAFWSVKPNIAIWDRVDLILAIFSKHAKTKEAKLQIELARMQNMGPRIYGMGMVLSRQGGGIGTRGIGETNTELMRRHWKAQIRHAKDELAVSAATRKQQMDHRKDLGLKTISLVGYTNAGKTSLFNILTHKKHLVENALFATLDSTVGEVFMPSLGKKVLISDTIGFIANLPPSLIEAFKSTLMESIHADLILHVIDASDPLLMDKVSVVSDILDQLEIPQEKEIYVFNKIDLAPQLDKQRISQLSGTIPHVFLSTKTLEGIDMLLSSLLPGRIS